MNLKMKRHAPPPEAKMTPQECNRLRVKVLKMTQAEFAKALGVTGVTVSRWETGAAPILEDRSIAIRLLSDKMRTTPASAAR